MHDSTTLLQKLDEHTQTMIRRHDGTIDIYGCEARAWMYAGMLELIELTTGDADFMNWLDRQEIALIDQANQARRARWVR